MVETSIVPEEVEQFGRLAGDWWDPNGALGDAAQAQSGAAQIYPRPGSTSIGSATSAAARRSTGKTRAGRRLRRGAAGRAAGAARREGHRDRCRRPKLIARRARPCRAAGAGRSTIAPATSRSSTASSTWSLHGSDRACRRSGGVRAGAGAAARAGRAADHVDAQRDRLVEAADDHHRRRARPDPARNPRFRQVHRARSG